MSATTTQMPQVPSSPNQTQAFATPSRSYGEPRGRQDLVSVATSMRADEKNGGVSQGATASGSQITYAEIEHLTRALRGVRHSHLSKISGMKKWEGRVLAVEDEYFTAELTAIEPNTGPPLEAEFPLDLLPGSDQAELAPGSVLYVTVRSVTGVAGMPERTSALRLRRLGNWTQLELDQARMRAQELSRELADLAD